MRIRTPVRGIYCSHRSAFDLEAYIRRSAQFNDWNCVICHNPIPIYQLIVDQAFQIVLDRAPRETLAVMMQPDLSFQVIEESWEQTQNYTLSLSASIIQGPGIVERNNSQHRGHSYLSSSNLTHASSLSHVYQACHLGKETK